MKLFPPRLARRQSGISLTEALVAMALIGIVVIALMRQESFSLAQVSEATNRVEAMRLAHQVIARFKAAGRANSGGDTVPGIDAQFQRRWTATWQRNPSRYDVTVKVSWKDRRGAGHEVAVAGQVFGQSIAGSGRLAAPYVVASTDAKGGDTPPPPPASGSGSDDGNEDKTGITKRVISGSIVATGQGAADGLSVSISGGGSCSLSGGAYSCSVPNGWTGTITVTSSAGAAVSPATSSFSNTTENVGGQDIFVVKR